MGKRHIIINVILIYIFGISIAYAGTQNATSCSFGDVQTAVNAASSGDTVLVPAGSCTWDSTLTLSKAITLQGTNTTIERGSTSGLMIDITTNSTTSTRITGFTFRQTTGSNVIKVTGGFSNAKFRIDHCNFYTPGSAVFLKILRSWGLIDHCNFTADNASEMIHNEAWGASSGGSGWTDVVTPGSGDALYVEDCTFTKYTIPISIIGELTHYKVTMEPERFFVITH